MTDELLCANALVLQCLQIPLTVNTACHAVRQGCIIAIIWCLSLLFQIVGTTDTGAAVSCCSTCLCKCSCLAVTVCARDMRPAADTFTF